jgi:hypothetical protein
MSCRYVLSGSLRLFVIHLLSSSSSSSSSASSRVLPPSHSPSPRRHHSRTSFPSNSPLLPERTLRLEPCPRGILLLLHLLPPSLLSYYPEQFLCILASFSSTSTSIAIQFRLRILVVCMHKRVAVEYTRVACADESHTFLERLFSSLQYEAVHGTCVCGARWSRYSCVLGRLADVET